MVDVDRVPGMQSGSRRRNLVVGAVYLIVILAIFGAVVGPTDDEENGDAAMDGGTETTVAPATTAPATTAADTTTPATTAPATTALPTTTEPTPTPEPQLTTLMSIEDVSDRYDQGRAQFSGNDDSVTEEFTTDGGPIVFVYEHSGESNFIVDVIDAETGEQVGLAANAIGDSTGARAVPDDGGTYRLEVTADGPWSIEAANPRPLEEDIHRIPVEASGQGPTVLGPLRVDGGSLVSATHDGESNFIVEAMDELAFSSLDSELIVNEVGEFDGEATMNYEGVVWITVEADGNWTLEFEDL